MPNYTIGIRITNPDGQQVTLTNAFTFVSAPTITAVTPASGPTSGGTVVNITGTGFQAGATVLFNGVPATNVSVNTDGTIITCTTPAVP